jgi:hypothetical protein
MHTQKPREGAFRIEPAAETITCTSKTQLPKPRPHPFAVRANVGAGCYRANASSTPKAVYPAVDVFQAPTYDKILGIITRTGDNHSAC